MPKKLIMLSFTGFLSVSLCGCIAMMTLMAENAKAKQDLNVSYSQALDIVKGSLKKQGIQFQEAVIKKDIAEVRGRYTDEIGVRIFIRKASDTQCNIAVRAGTSDAGKKDAEKILQAIVSYSESVVKQ
ncbi:MAG: DUF3568 family protein [Candidatus Omnitrophota bacterium]